MRIIAGKNRGTKLIAPTGSTTRPTSDRARESLFNILMHRYQEEMTGSVVLDVFAGSGALGLEALSRGAARVIFIEQERAACEAIRKNIILFHAQNSTRLVVADACRPPRSNETASVIFLDPPYHSGLVERSLEALAMQGWIREGALLILEQGPNEILNMASNDFFLLDERQWGKAHCRFLRYRRPNNRSISASLSSI